MENPTYSLKSFVVNSGSDISSLAAVSILYNDNNVVEGIAKGNGPIEFSPLRGSEPDQRNFE